MCLAGIASLKERIKVKESMKNISVSASAQMLRIDSGPHPGFYAERMYSAVLWKLFSEESEDGALIVGLSS